MTTTFNDIVNQKFQIQTPSSEAQKLKEEYEKT
jgi:hypothetical protein